MPADPVTGGAWQVREYRRRGARAAAGLWAVLAGGSTSMVVILAMLLAGAAVVGADSLLLLACAAVVLAATAAGLTAAAHRARALSRWLSARHHRSRYTWRLAAAVAGLERQHTGFHRGVAVLACTASALLADAGVLAACFGLAGLPVPWCGLRCLGSAAWACHQERQAARVATRARRPRLPRRAADAGRRAGPCDHVPPDRRRSAAWCKA